MEESKTFFAVTYRDPENLKDNKVISIKVRAISDSDLGISFVKLHDFIFEQSGVLVNPTEEKLQKRFEHTKSLHLSIYSIISIEEIGNEQIGLAFKQDKSNLVVLPSNNPTN